MLKQARSEAKYKMMAQTLRGRIIAGAHPVGHPLPTIKDLAAEFDVSFVTAFRAVGELSREGFVSTASKRSGTMVVRNQPATARATTIACLLRAPHPRNESDNFGLDMIQGLREEISRRGYRMIYHGLDEQDYEGRVTQLLDDAGICGVIMDQKTPPGIVTRLARAGLPAVLFNAHLAAPNLTTVTPDYEASGRAAADLLIAKGYARLAFYKMPRNESALPESATGDYYPLRTLRQGFVDRARERGFAGDALLLLDEPARPDLGAEPETYTLPRRRGNDWRSIGLFCNHDGLAVALLEAVAKTDLVIGRDVGVLGCLDLEVGRRHARPPSTWSVNREAIGAAAVRELLARVEAPALPAASLRLAMTLLDRGTA
jgi:DNA-binding LacI/PurR family transcriptional regulator